MSEENIQNGQAQEAGAPEYAIQKLYVRDLSLEAPHAPEIFNEAYAPQIEMEMNAKNRQVGEDLFEVVLAITVTAKLGEKVAYLAEVHQAGLFTIKNLDPMSLRHAVQAFSPNILFPYAREAVSDLVTRAGFPPLVLQPVNFDALFAQQIQREQAQAAAPAPESVQ
ncbi:MAG: protein-export chaperone SecB [Gammaproteobacteria bacterium]|nr:protein-export chaperone SecB [Gammaproteobacteria bacterium]